MEVCLIVKYLKWDNYKLLTVEIKANIAADKETLVQYFGFT